MDWFDRSDARVFHLASVVLAELLSGIARMPLGRRRRERQSYVDRALEEVFGNRILDFDRRAAEAYANLTARAARNGRPISVPDGQIGAIAAVHGFSVATRDTAPFIAMGLPVIDPWQPGA